MFTKAMPMNSRLKLSMYGEPGSGKTFTALLFAEGLAKLRGGRIAFLDTEGGTKFYDRAIEERKIHPEVFDFDRVLTRSLSQALSEVRSLDPKTHPVLVVDSITHLWDAAMDAWRSKHPGEEDIPLRAWSAIKKPYKDLLKLCLDLPVDFILCGRQKNTFAEENGKLTNTGVAMRAEGETQFEPDLCFHMQQVGRRGEACRVTLFAEKDRSGILEGRTIESPTYADIEPLVRYLGDTQDTVDADEDDRAAKDAELLETEQEKLAKKRQKSADLLDGFQTRISNAKVLEDLGAIKTDIKKQQRHLVEDHLNALRLHFTAKSTKITEAVTGGV